MERPRPHNKRPTVNVCLNSIVNSVKCDHPCSEGYDVGNLVSNNVLERSKGFLVEGFVKPPVIITFDFNCEIDLKYIYIQCNVGGQRSSGVELFIYPSTIPEKHYESISSGVLKGYEKGFVFHRHSENVRTKFGDEFYFRSFKSSRYLSVVKSVQLKIFRTDGSSVPALGKVEFWGIPRKYLPNIDNHIKNQKLVHTHQSSKVSEVKHNLMKPVCGKRSVSPLRGFSQNIKVPEDFIDPITCEIMCQPVTLPSGKVIDISTLKSHEKAEAQWGRGPSDPFTGILFTSSSKPVISSDLKARIDKFLCDNSNDPEFHKIPRTVGRSCASAQKLVDKPSVSKLICNNAQVLHNSLTKKTINNALQTSSGPSENHVKRRKKEENTNQDCNILLDISKRQISINPTSSFSSPAFCTRPTKKSSNLSFQERMEKSLELSLKSTLSKFPSFIADDHKCNEKSQVECNVCKACDNLFSIPCLHFICRNCLVRLKTKGTMSCSFCNSSFESHEVQKVHVKS